MLVKWFNFTKCNIQFGVDNYVHEKEKKNQMNTNGTEIFSSRCVNKHREGYKGRVIIMENNSVYNVKKSCRGDVNNHTSMMNQLCSKKKN